MTSFLRLFGISCIAVISVAITTGYAQGKQLPTPNKTKIHHTQTGFSAIYCAGPIQLNIRSVRGNRQAYFSVSKKYHAVLQAHVRHHILYLKSTSQALSRKPIRVTAWVNHLNRLTVYRRASVNAKHINSQHLVIIANTIGTIRFSGKIAIEKIHANGNTHVKIYNIASPKLFITGKGNAKMKLAGNVNQVQISLYGNAYLDARKLRAHTVAIQTRQYANAKVFALNTLRAFATKHSNIYYYTRPKYLTRYSKSEGNILLID